MLLRYLIWRILNAGLVVSIVASDCSRIGTALVDRDLFRSIVTSYRLAQKTKRGLQSRLAVSRKSTVALALSTARSRYFQTPLTFT